MVTRSQLDGLKPRAGGTFNPEETFAKWLAEAREALPDWDADPSGILYRSLRLIVALLATHYETADSQWARGLPPELKGDDLDRWGLLLGVPRLTGESDDAYLLRLANARRSAPITTDGFKREIQQFNPDIRSVGLRKDPANFQLTTVYAVKSDATLLNTGEVLALQAFVDRDDIRPDGYKDTVSQPTVTAYTIAITGSYNPGEINEANALAQMRTNVYDYIVAHQALDTGIYANDILAAALRDVSGVFNIGITSPAANLDPDPAVVYTCGRTDADVMITLTGA